ncbi:hypothetical protein H5410_037090 [Solanum commersonii]|uniref:Uncharacterized protein n=1 Tax=Solanum commersonii TaxID=4109 RepID=A0A9J5Y714_SOLCO|nr:hypothetical protein H5410_037090 [Solanum commersonii]
MEMWMEIRKHRRKRSVKLLNLKSLKLSFMFTCFLVRPDLPLKFISFCSCNFFHFVSLLSVISLSIGSKFWEKNRVLTVHGSADEIIPVEDALEFDKIIPNHKLHIIEGANHCYTSHQAELTPVILPFIKEVCYNLTYANETTGRVLELVCVIQNLLRLILVITTRGFFILDVELKQIWYEMNICCTSMTFGFVS